MIMLIKTLVKSVNVGKRGNRKTQNVGECLEAKNMDRKAVY